MYVCMHVCNSIQWAHHVQSQALAWTSRPEIWLADHVTKLGRRMHFGAPIKNFDTGNVGNRQLLNTRNRHQIGQQGPQQDRLDRPWDYEGVQYVKSHHY